MVTNKKLGNDFETEFCEILAAHGFWVHNMVQSKAGQPADVIAVKNKHPFLIDCKVCSNDIFVLSRIEENQHYAMTMWRDCGNGGGWFALKFADQTIVMIRDSILINLSRNDKALTKSMILPYAFPLDRWMKWS